MENDKKDEVVLLYLDDIIPNRFQPREVFDEKALKELAVSIKEHGVIQPIIVRNVNNKYEIIAGERRYKASALAGMTKIPAIIRNLDDKESSKVALLENLQRKNLTPIEEARTYQKILEIDQMTQEELAKTMGKSQSAVANKLRLLSLPDEIQDSLLKEQISERHARALLNVEDVQKQKDLLKKIIQNKMSVRAVEEEIKRINGKDQIIKENKPIEDISMQDQYINTVPLEPTDIMNPIQPIKPIQDIVMQPAMSPIIPESSNKFINYADVETEEDQIKESPDFNNFDNIVEPVDINKIKENTHDIISPIQQKDSGNLDSLLNIKPPVINKPTEYFTAPEMIKKTDLNIAESISSPEYFTASGIPTVDLPMIEEQKDYTVELAMDKIRKLIDDLKAHNLNVRMDEMNFEKAMQVIIKIDKPNQ